jgi:hypothetical protein
VVGFSRLMGLDEAGTHRALGELRRAIDPLIASHGGRIVGTAGDSMLADFSSVVDALSCAVEIQLAARAINDPIPPDRRLELRIGVNLGDVIVDGDDIFGDGVNIAPASRLSPSLAPFASPTLFTSRSGISSISTTVRSAAIASRISPSRFAPTWLAPRPSLVGRENSGGCWQQQGHADSLRQALLHGRFTRVRVEICWGWPRPSRSKSLALLSRIVSPGAPRWRCCRSRTCRQMQARIS